MVAFVFRLFNDAFSDSAIGLANGYGLDDQGWVRVRVPVGSRIFTSLCRQGRLWVPLNLLYNGYRGLFTRGVKRQGREAPVSVEIN
jgi:hypothetical protein